LLLPSGAAALFAAESVGSCPCLGGCWSAGTPSSCLSLRPHSRWIDGKLLLRCMLWPSLLRLLLL
jgi:hypothetical protein